MKRFNLLAITLSSVVAIFIAMPSESALQLPFASFVYPILAPRVSSNFGSRTHPVLRYVRHHDGIDLAAPEGATIRAIDAGRVVYADPYAGYGNLIVIQHKTGITSHYGHCSIIKVKPGALVKAGEVIGLVGKTGLVTGPHLHFEIRVNGIAQDPQKFLPGLAMEAQG